MKKISTIAAVIFLSTFTAAVAQADTITFSGTIASACSLTATAPTASLTSIGTPPSALSGQGSVKVKCNDSTKSLKLALGTNTLPSGAVSFKLSGGTGIFTNVSTGTQTTLSPTDFLGDNANFNVVVSNGDVALKTGAYSVVIDATITP